MLSLIIDFVNEYQEATSKKQYIGNERMAEYEASFKEALEDIINARIRAWRDSDNYMENR